MSYLCATLSPPLPRILVLTDRQSVGNVVNITPAASNFLGFFLYIPILDCVDFEARPTLFFSQSVLLRYWTTDAVVTPANRRLCQPTSLSIHGRSWDFLKGGDFLWGLPQPPIVGAREGQALTSRKHLGINGHVIRNWSSYLSRKCGFEMEAWLHEPPTYGYKCNAEISNLEP